MCPSARVIPMVKAPVREMEYTKKCVTSQKFVHGLDLVVDTTLFTD
jgi:hypothetical protein